jgi:uncharacterized coiled-coil DUF342 family protein
MNIWEWLTVFGFTATILGVFLTIYGMINNRTLKAEAKGIRDILDRMDQRHEETRRELAESRKDMAEAFKKMDNTLSKMDERAAKMDERSERQSQMLVRIEDTQRYVAELVKIEGEKTREAIRV